MSLLAVTLLALPLLLALGCSGDRGSAQTDSEPTAEGGTAQRLHWFIPDGMRADPDVMTVFEWAQSGELPNIKALMDRGAWGYSIPTFPTHTPTNFATLLTGAYPERHGVADGPMHVEGHPLQRPSVGGFSSVARKLPAVWTLLEGAGKRPFLLSVPGSTPPELRGGGMTVRGRWGGWGADLHSMIFEQASTERLLEVGRGARLFFLGDDLTRFVEMKPAEGWTGPNSKAAMAPIPAGSISTA